MNPENQQNQQKPNFERIGWIKEIHTEEGLSELNKKWENIQKGKISYPEDSLLEDLLKNEEYHLEAFLPDFRFMGFIFKERIEKEKRLKELNETIFKDLKIEYLQALKYLQENKKSEIKISTVTDSKGITIKNPELIDLIYKSLLEYADKADNISSWEKLFKQAGMNLRDYIDYRLHIEKGKTSKRGRKIESYAIYTIVYFLRKYLQENTEIGYFGLNCATKIGDIVPAVSVQPVPLNG